MSVRWSLCSHPLTQRTLSAQQHSRKLSRPPITCWLVLVEAAYLLRKHPNFVQSLLASVEGGGIEIDSLTDPNTVPVVRSLMARYSASGLQVADACLISVAATSPQS